MADLPYVLFVEDEETPSAAGASPYWNLLTALT
jgi:hypothetical protein